MSTKHGMNTNPANIVIPTGQAMAYNHPITEARVTARLAHKDVPGVWAQSVNDLFEHTKPPIQEVLSFIGFSVSTAEEDIARWMLPVWMVGGNRASGAGQEGLICGVYGAAAGGSTNTYRLVTNDDNETVTTSTSTDHWKDVPDPTVKRARIIDPVIENITNPISRDTEVVLSGFSDTDNVLMTVNAIDLRWAAGSDGQRTFLGSKVFDGSSDFVPLPTSGSGTANYADESEPLSVEKMQRLARDLVDLKRRRTPGMILTSNTAQRSGTGFSVGALQRHFWARAWQQEFAQSARVWVYGSANGFGNTAFTGWIGTLGQDSATQSFDDFATTDVWTRVDLFVPPVPRNSAPVPLDFFVEFQNFGIGAVTAFWKELEI